MISHTDIAYVWVHLGRDRAVEDLRYSLRSLEQNWGDGPGQTFRVFIVGDRPPHWHDMMHVPHTHESSAVNGLRFPKAVDAVRKMKEILRCADIGERFLYMSDDIVLLKPTGPQYFDKLIAQSEFTGQENFSISRFGKLMENTYKALKAYGLKRVFHYETHMPRLFEKRKMWEVIQRFDPEKNLLLLPTLYYNYHYPGQQPTLLHKLDNVKVAFLGADGPHTYPRSRHTDPELACAYHLDLMLGKRFLNWNDNGIRDHGLFYALTRMFPEPSSFEVARRNAPPNPLTITR